MLHQDSAYSREKPHPIWAALLDRDLEKVWRITKKADDWCDLVVPAATSLTLRGQSVLHLVAGQKPKKGAAEPQWYEVWCSWLCERACDAPKESGYLWVGRG